MDSFDKRGESFEKKFALDQDILFRASARRNKQIAIWAMEKVGRAHESDAYFKKLVAADLEEKGDEDIVRRLAADFSDAGVEVSPLEIREKLDEAMASAIEDVKAGH